MKRCGFSVTEMNTPLSPLSRGEVGLSSELVSGNFNFVILVPFVVPPL